MRRETSDRHKSESNPEGLIHGTLDEILAFRAVTLAPPDELKVHA